jgi:membrane fusion protein (multidrug efflux system)
MQHYDLRACCVIPFRRLIMLSPNPHSRIPTLAAVLLVVAIAGCGKKEVAPAAPPAQAVTVVTLQSQEVTLTRELPGRVNAFLIAEVRPQVSGLVQQRLFTEGALVKAGQPLYRLEDAAYRANTASAKAAVARAQATLHSAQLNARRSAELVEIDAVSKQDNENAAATLGQAQADLAAAEAALQSSNVTLDYTRITSPISGRIGKSSVTQGALVTANQVAPLSTVQRLDKVYVDLTQSSSELLALRKELSAGTLSTSGDLPVQILLEDGSKYPHPGTLTFSDVTVDPTTGSVALRVSVSNPDDVLLPGTYVRALIGNGIRQDALLVPQQGITRDPKGNATAMIVNKDGKVEPRTVQANRTVGDKWLIDGGLVAGDRVIIEGLQKIGPGAAVTATEAAVAKPATAAAAASTSPQK